MDRPGSGRGGRGRLALPDGRHHLLGGGHGVARLGHRPAVDEDGELALTTVLKVHLDAGLALQRVRHTGGMLPDARSDRALTDRHRFHGTTSVGDGAYTAANRAPVLAVSRDAPAERVTSMPREPGCSASVRPRHALRWRVAANGSQRFSRSIRYSAEFRYFSCACPGYTRIPSTPAAFSFSIRIRPSRAEWVGSAGWSPLAGPFS